ncbi:MAG: YbhB/YbcL family Raf kinase inhibitor-like protein [Gammaproteobacteria bacterium]
MKLSSTAFSEGGSIPSQYTCDGDNISPPLTIKEVPENAKSLVLIMDDPDVPSNVRRDNMWDHWLVFNISPQTDTIPENEEPAGVPGKGTAGNLTYFGPCPPDREHRYFFKLYALDSLLTLEEGATKVMVEQAMAGHVLAEAQLMGRYEKLSGS